MASTLNGATVRAMIWASSVAVISWFASISTSPVSESITLPPVRRPTSASALTAIRVTPDSTSFSIDFGLSALPAWTSTSLPFGALTSSAGRAPLWTSGLSLTQASRSSKA